LLQAWYNWSGIIVVCAGQHGSVSQYADYCVVASAYEEEFDTADVHVGGTQDLGPDGLATIVNGVLISSVEEASDLLDVNGFLDVKFIFVQAKTSSGFSAEEIATFFDGVDEFFADNPTLPRE